MKEDLGRKKKFIESRRGEKEREGSPHMVDGQGKEEEENETNGRWKRRVREKGEGEKV